MVDWDPVECDSCEGKEECHSPHGGEQDASSAKAIDDHQVDPGKEEVCSSDDGTDSNRVGKTDKSEEC